jgi:predicted  nucleic acid-binding Zn-ribbon protein
MTTFTELIAGKEFNGRIYGTPKYGFNVYLNGEKTILTDEQATQAFKWIENKSKKSNSNSEIRLIDDEIDTLEEYLPRVIRRHEKRVAKGSDLAHLTAKSISDAKQKLADLFARRDELVSFLDGAE